MREPGAPGGAAAHPRRRSVLKSALAVGLSACLPPALSACTGGDRPESLIVAGGEPGGFYLEFATLLAAALERHGLAQHARAVTTGGSLDNIAELRAGRAAFAVALADAANQEPGADAAGIAAVGKVYENYVHCVVRKDSGIREISGLAGRRVAVGQPGSGTSLTTPRLFEAAGLGTSAGAAAPPAGSAAVENLGLNDGIAALKAGAVDALFWSGGVPTAAIAAAQQEVALGLLDLSGLLPELRRRYGGIYDRVLIPEGSYPGVPAVWTVGAPNLLLCRRDLDNATVERTVQLLVHSAAELIPQSSLGVQFLSAESLINTAGVPLHPAAADAYRALHG
ncbi:C4-dicarboxylate ABC transporter substrate-binding protein [Arthrobacter sp. StoSoilB19]|uniref:TAXI family TRAP transporter solute-binding subunit n=1 Tax=Arthrobacter sp. StoSoilB19 TaxID=2830994 RepID=UPI0003A1D0C9|nr:MULTISPECIES: TAXI family TRAP transporter solute-binding subunit [unclassified Arthrobacter]BCW53216.1 C4-dicarboxylate ABC transporter substrate-binding protein [Arthrobacter sp. StoSoilB19]